MVVDLVANASSCHRPIPLHDVFEVDLEEEAVDQPQVGLADDLVLWWWWWERAMGMVVVVVMMEVEIDRANRAHACAGPGG